MPFINLKTNSSISKDTEEKIKLEKNFEDYQYAIILRAFERLVKDYPNNKLEFRME